jgi:hypothetical protein
LWADGGKGEGDSQVLKAMKDMINPTCPISTVAVDSAVMSITKLNLFTSPDDEKANLMP